MAYDEALAARVRRLFETHPGYGEKKMFGGVCFLLEGKMCAGVNGADLMARIGPEQHREVMRDPGVREMTFTGRPMEGFVFVGSEGTATDADLERWILRTVRYVSALPARKARAKKARE